MLFRQIFDEKLAQYAYLVGCQQTGEALVIDPERDVERYAKAAEAEEAAKAAEEEANAPAEEAATEDAPAEEAAAEEATEDKGE